MFQEIRDPLNGHLLARIDPERRLLELQRKKSTFLVDLLPYLEGKSTLVAGDASQEKRDPNP